MAKTAGKLSFLLIMALLAASGPVLGEETALLTYPASFFAGA